VSENAVDLMVLAAHPDDAEIGCGGTILRCADAGRRVAIVDLTRGETGTRGTPEQRAKEAEAAVALLGVVTRENLGMPDGALTEDEASVAALVEVIRRLRPAILLAPFERDVHPDHVAAAHLARRAFFHAGLVKVRPDLGAPFRPRALLRYPSLESVTPTFCIDVSAVAERKRAVIACYASQIPGDPAGKAHYVRGLDPIERADVRDRWFGALCGVPAAEPFLTDGPLSLDLLDPLRTGSST
jgi:bacillithiol biosynthesis deacetylase BshB1